MTRINVIPPAHLTDQHLIAEYRELPRVFRLAQAWVDRGKPGPIPARYTLGAGHVRFFYPRTGWLAARQALLIDECLDRGFDISHRTPPQPVEGADGSWEPDDEAMELNLDRLATRLLARPDVHRLRRGSLPGRWYGVYLCSGPGVVDRTP